MIYRDTTAIEAVNAGRDTPDAYYAKSTLMATSKWHSTDAWRGYTEIVPEPGFKAVDDTWMTGDWEDAPTGHGESAVEAKLAELEREYGQVYVIYTPTSNVFSTGVDVIVRDAETAPKTRQERGKLIHKATRRWDYPDGSFKVRYHATDVISFDAKTGKYTLNTGGWNTMTTSKRMSEALPSGYYTYRRDWVMYVHTPDGDLELKDGMEV